MDKDQIARLKELAEKADEIIAPNELWAHCNRKVCADYIAAANPQAVLALIAELERLEKEADWLAEELLDSNEAWDTVEEWRRDARKAVERGNE